MDRPPLEEDDAYGLLCNSPRASGIFLLRKDTIPLLKGLSVPQKARLSYWIFDHNRRYPFWDEPIEIEDLPILNLDPSWAETRQCRIPATKDRILSFLRGLIRIHDQGLKNQADMPRLAAASGCFRDKDFIEFWKYAADKKWIDGWMGKNGDSIQIPDFVSLAARMHVEARERTEGQGRQGFVAMWFAPCMDAAYAEGFSLAIEMAGYKPCRIDRVPFVGKIDDQIITEIRQSRFVVADFTCGKEGARGGVYYEAGFALGLNPLENG